MLDSLVTERANPASEGIDSLSTEEILQIINSEDRKVAEAVAAEIPQIAKAVDVITARIQAGGHLFYIGAGTSGRLGVLDASECPPTYRVAPDLVQGIIAGGDVALRRSTEAAEDDPEAGRLDLAAYGLKSEDVLVGIAASGRTPYVLGAIEAASRIGAVTIGVSSNPESPLSRLVDIAITPVTGPEVVAGSTRMKAGTATKLVLNMLSTAAMIRLGHVYGNLMVNVQPVNSKLAERARRIVAQAAHVDVDEAARLIEAAGGDVKVAIVMGLTGEARSQAQERLSRAAGRVSAALAG
jgi:N-acetylmuramic acid 6-phosphate etherase